jgi:hypothetical protein
LERIFFFLLAALFLAAFLLAPFAQFVARCEFESLFAPSRPAPDRDGRPIVSALRIPGNKNGASPNGPAPLLFTLYSQNIKPKGVKPPQTATLYSYANEQLTKKSSTSGS